MDAQDLLLRDYGASQADDVEYLRDTVDDLEDQVVSLTKEAAKQKQRADASEEAVQYCTNKMVRTALQTTIAADESWAAGLRWAAKAQEMSLALEKITPVVLAGIQHSNPVMSQLCHLLIENLHLSTDSEIKRIRDVMAAEAAVIEEKKKEALLEYKRALENAKKKKSGPGSRNTARTPGTPSGSRPSINSGSGSAVLTEASLITPELSKEPSITGGNSVGSPGKGKGKAVSKSKEKDRSTTPTSQQGDGKKAKSKPGKKK